MILGEIKYSKKKDKNKNQYMIESRVARITILKVISIWEII